MTSNGNIPSSALRPIAGGGRLVPGAAAAWNAMAAYIYREEGVKIAPNGDFSSYRTFPQQVYMKQIYGDNAATPGESNHGLGIAVDSDDHYWINKHGARFGWQKRWSDADWEPWHMKYASGHYDGRDPGPDYSTKPPKPKWWRRVKNRLKQVRERRRSKRLRRKRSPHRRALLHRQIQKLSDAIRKMVKRRKNW